MVVIKFGGAILGSSPDSFHRMTEVLGTLPGGMVVVSALGRTTQDLSDAAELAQQSNLQGALGIVDQIVAMHHEMAEALLPSPSVRNQISDQFVELQRSLVTILRSVSVTRQLSLRTRDRILAYGEDFSIALVRAVLQQADIRCSVIDARLWLLTSDDHGSATPQLERTQERFNRVVVPQLRPGAWVLTQGFVAATELGATTTMGKESSNLTATVAGLMMTSKSIIIVTDVPGVRSADPHMIPRTELRPELSFQQARTAAQHGVKLLYPTMIEPAERAGIPIILRDLAGSDEQVTIIGPASASHSRPIVSLQPPTSPEAPYRIAIVCITAIQWLWVLQVVLKHIPDLPVSVHSSNSEEWVEVSLPSMWDGSITDLLRMIHGAMLEAADRYPRSQHSSRTAP
ncbi:MAG: hypothetical protein ACO3E0_07135 [Candidatus Kapaibacteriota bacterium]